MTETATAEAPDDTEVTEDEPGEASPYAFDETPLATSQAAYLTKVKSWTADQRQGIWGQTLN